MRSRAGSWDDVIGWTLHTLLRVEPLRRPPITFAHRGGRAHAAENTLDAFRLALDMGACGLESDVWLTADGVPVLHHDDRVRNGIRRPRVTKLARAALPASVPTLEDLYRTCGTDFELSLDVKDRAAALAAIDVARAAGSDAPGRLWLCHPDWELLAAWRAASPDVKLVNSTKLQRMPRGPERRAAQLAEAGVDAVNLHYREWTGGLTTLFHRFGRLAFAWDAQHERVVRELVGMGVDAVYSDHVDRLVAVMGRRC